MYISYSNEIVDQFSKEIHKYEKVKEKLSQTDEVKSYKNHIVNLKTVIKDIKDSIKFKIPSCNQLLPEDSSPLDVLKKFVEVANLPFPSICLELEAFSATSNQELQCVILAKQEEEYIHIYALNKVDEWQLMENKKTDELIFIDLNRVNFEAWAGGFKPEDYSEKNFLGLLQWLHDVALRSVVNVLCTLSCSNAHIDDHTEKPSKIKNDLRKNKKKLPFFEFKILTVDSGKGASQKSVNSVGGTHVSPRVHLRRGHIRKLPKKNIWVNACVVGDKSKGEITKDYLVK